MDTSGGKGRIAAASPASKSQQAVQPQSLVQPQVGKPFDGTSADAQAPADRQGVPAGAKEQEVVGQVGDSELVPIVELHEPRELPEEVAGWLERVERDDIPEPATIVHEGKPIVSPVAPNQAQVTLPLTADDLKKGLHQKLIESFRWLAEWCWRLIKKYHGKVAYKLGRNEPFDDAQDK